MPPISTPRPPAWRVAGDVAGDAVGEDPERALAAGQHGLSSDRSTDARHGDERAFGVLLEEEGAPEPAGNAPDGERERIARVDPDLDADERPSRGPRVHLNRDVDIGCAEQVRHDEVGRGVYVGGDALGSEEHRAGAVADADEAAERKRDLARGDLDRVACLLEARRRR